MTPITTTVLETAYRSYSPKWQAAMQRALAEDLHKEVRVERVDGDVVTYSVPSTTFAPGTRHEQTEVTGAMKQCTCPGWRGFDCPCKHAGAVEVYKITEGLRVVERISSEESVVEAPRVRRTQLYRSEVA